MNDNNNIFFFLKLLILPVLFTYSTLAMGQASWGSIYKPDFNGNWDCSFDGRFATFRIYSGASQVGDNLLARTYVELNDGGNIQEFKAVNVVKIDKERKANLFPDTRDARHILGVEMVDLAYNAWLFLLENGKKKMSGYSRDRQNGPLYSFQCTKRL